eukprot:1143156-Pelagomonas_calceolata.AAC.5
MKKVLLELPAPLLPSPAALASEAATVNTQAGALTLVSPAGAACPSAALLPGHPLLLCHCTPAVPIRALIVWDAHSLNHPAICQL